MTETRERSERPALASASKREPSRDGVETERSFFLPRNTEGSQAR